MTRTVPYIPDPDFVLIVRSDPSPRPRRRSAERIVMRGTWADRLDRMQKHNDARALPKDAAVPNEALQRAHQLAQRLRHAPAPRPGGQP